MIVSEHETKIDLPPVIDKFLDDQEIEIERMMAKEYSTDDFDE